MSSDSDGTVNIIKRISNGVLLKTDMNKITLNISISQYSKAVNLNVNDMINEIFGIDSMPILQAKSNITFKLENNVDNKNDKDKEKGKETQKKRNYL